MSDFKKLQVWEKAHALAIHAYRVATRMRRSCDLPLRGQAIRAAISIPANIVEGRRQESDLEFARFLRIALNSAYELEYHLILARDIEAISQSDSESLVRECIQVRRMIYGLLKKLGHPAKARIKNATKPSQKKLPANKPQSFQLPAFSLSNRTDEHRSSVRGNDDQIRGNDD